MATRGDERVAVGAYSLSHEQYVLVTRSWGDHRTVALPQSALGGRHMAVEHRGDRGCPLLPRHALGVYVPGTVLDAEIAAQGVELGRGGSHGSGNAAVVTRCADTPRSLRRMRAEDERHWPSRAYAEKRRALWLRRNERRGEGS